MMSFQILSCILKFSVNTVTASLTQTQTSSLIQTRNTWGTSALSYNEVRGTGFSFPPYLTEKKKGVNVLATMILEILR